MTERLKREKIVSREDVSEFREVLQLACGHSREVAKSRPGARKRVLCLECNP